MPSPSDAIRALVDRLPEQELRRPGGRAADPRNGSADPKLAERRASANAARGRQAGPARAIKANGTGHGNGSTSVSAKRLWRRRKARTR